MIATGDKAVILVFSDFVVTKRPLQVKNVFIGFDSAAVMGFIISIVQCTFFAEA
ncbi:hypothetical protein ABENE_12585 [Asticcacaulis benevestitus DSM 16100 = ATCC BAA-896]|uniref:Uncharacterized protein n=1 Tax=Asticcacaulis benevestitus DSM 16100 = ATCC BAA-896 TaxID=1121022 RepID=V4PXW4_9CAUL|nr:hypothetical protein ABENE_12585 [Asticcacaulis benevestitus DSM 16100 = ATCC BAA-896]